jgi:hypothetical protein
MALAAALFAAHAVPCLIVSVAAERSAEAMTAREVTLRELVTLADLVIDGTPAEAKSVWEDTSSGKRIVTYTRVSVSNVVYGNASSDVWVRTIGGTVGKIGQRVEGETVLVPGERAVLFLVSRGDGTHGVAEMSQGHYLVDVSNGAKLKASPHLANLLKRENPPAPYAREVLVGKAIDAATSAIRDERKAAGL